MDEQARKERLTAALSVLIKDMDVPEMRRQLRDQDIMWLGRNLAINNGRHPNLERSLLVVKKLQGIIQRSA